MDVNEPIINPWIILLIDKIGDIDILANIGFCLSLVTFLLSIIVWWIYDGRHEAKQKALKVMRWCVILVSVFGAACLIVPSKMTCYKMLAASYVTPANIQVTTDKAIELIDRVAEIIRKGHNDET